MRKVNKGFIWAWLAFLAGVIALVFWYSEYQYSLPTPVPTSYHNVPTGTKIDLEQKFNDNSKPVFLHFFNPSCPCSRFNIKHVKELIDKYQGDVNFAIVLVSAKDIQAKDIREKYDISVPVFSDTSIATRCGVYSTPQAVILTPGRTLYYRGNYNRNRYCTDKKTNYAQIALDQLLYQKPKMKFDHFALKAYGCSLPGCKTN